MASNSLKSPLLTGNLCGIGSVCHLYSIRGTSSGHHGSPGIWFVMKSIILLYQSNLCLLDPGFCDPPWNTTESLADEGLKCKQTTVRRSRFWHGHGLYYCCSDYNQDKYFLWSFSTVGYITGNGPLNKCIINAQNTIKFVKQLP